MEVLIRLFQNLVNYLVEVSLAGNCAYVCLESGKIKHGGLLTPVSRSVSSLAKNKHTNHICVRYRIPFPVACFEIQVVQVLIHGSLTWYNVSFQYGYRAIKIDHVKNPSANGSILCIDVIHLNGSPPSELLRCVMSRHNIEPFIWHDTSYQPFFWSYSNVECQCIIQR